MVTAGHIGRRDTTIQTIRADRDRTAIPESSVSTSG
jgi:hypothetical protein